MEAFLTEQEKFEAKLGILGDILLKKKEALLAVLGICENQELLYSSPNTPERRDFLIGLAKEKQLQIDGVLACDDMFQGVFDSISDYFQANGAEYAERVRSLQGSINEVLELDVKIRAQEEKTKAAAQAAWGTLAGKLGKESSQKEATPANTSYILDQYRNNNRNKPRLYHSILFPESSF
jgi:hypothetical protein